MWQLVKEILAVIVFLAIVFVLYLTTVLGGTYLVKTIVDLIASVV